jgi:hypothetical protein
MMDHKNITGNEKSGWARIKATASQVVAADVSRRSRRCMITQNPPTYVGSYGSTRAGRAKSLNSRIGLLQVVDFHDFSGFFLHDFMFGKRDQPANRGAPKANRFPNIRVCSRSFAVQWAIRPKFSQKSRCGRGIFARSSFAVECRWNYVQRLDYPVEI